MSPLRHNYIFITGFFAVVFAAALFWWLGSNGPFDQTLRLPNTDNRPPVVVRSDSVVIGEFYDSMGTMREIAYGEWPRFRGVDFDNINKDTVTLAEAWDTATGPPVLWKVPLGEGYAGPVVKNGKVYVLDYNERRKTDVLRCFSLASGEELWRRWYYVEMKRNHGYSRTIPAVTDDYVLTLGPRSHVMCVDPDNGNLIWTLDLEQEYGIPGWKKGRITPDFYSGQCPLIDNGVAVIAPGIKALMIGIDCATGEVLWETPNPDSIKMSHGSIIPMTIHNKRMYVYNGVGGVCGVSAEDEDRGKLLWSTTGWSPATTAASPLYLGNNEIAVFGSYGAGGGKLSIGFDGSRFTAAVSGQHKANEGIASDQQTPIFKDNHIWTVMPENAGELKRQLVCYNRSDLRKPVWASGKENRYGRGLGPYIMSGDKLYLLDDDGKLYLFRIEGARVTPLASHKIIDGIEAWGPIAIAGKHLIMRDSKNLVCLDIGK
jgi:outer membrane protein assembly factor BamB